MGLRLEWAQRYPQQLAALLRAVYRAAQWVEAPGNHTEVARLLAEPRYVGVSSGLLRRALANRLALLPGAEPVAVEDFFVAARHAATFPWTSHALWIYSQMVRWGQLEAAAGHLDAVRSSYRPDLYRSALARLDGDIPETDLKIEHFFDGGYFDPHALSDRS